MTRLESFSLQHTGRKKNPTILTWPLDLEIHSSKPKIPDVIHFEENLYLVLKQKEEDNSENQFDQYLRRLEKRIEKFNRLISKLSFQSFHMTLTQFILLEALRRCQLQVMVLARKLLLLTQQRKRGQGRRSSIYFYRVSSQTLKTPEKCLYLQQKSFHQL